MELQQALERLAQAEERYRTEVQVWEQCARSYVRAEAAIHEASLALGAQAAAQDNAEAQAAAVVESMKAMRNAAFKSEVFDEAQRSLSRARDDWAKALECAVAARQKDQP